MIDALPYGRAIAPTVHRSILAREAFTLFVITTQFKRAGQQLVHVYLLADRLTGGGSFTFVDKIAATKLVGLEAQPTGNFVEMPLESKYALRRAKSSKCTVWRNICSHSARANAHVRAIIRTRGVNRSSREHHRRKCAVSATVDDKLDLHGEQLSAFRYRGLVTSARWMPLGGRDHVFSTVVYNLYRLT